MNHYRKVLFPTYIYHYNLKGHNKVLKDILVPKIEQYLKDYPAPDKSPPGWISSNIITSWGRNTINQKLFAQSAEVNKCYKEHFMKIFGMTVKSSVKFTDAWFNYYIDGQYQEPHDHINPDYNTPDPHFSAIHFLQFDKNIHQPVKFVDPNSKLNRRHLKTDIYTPEIEEGDIIVFPCHLTHFVNASEPTPEYPRISVAFNINIQEEI
jgi:hypothetical protein|tara:strand:+ start:884 stop:1507 length:624 start_codon:yes stop_codon:yes gene_type:complete